MISSNCSLRSADRSHAPHSDMNIARPQAITSKRDVVLLIAWGTFRRAPTLLNAVLVMPDRREAERRYNQRFTKYW
jgi:hypothetical protein